MKKISIACGYSLEFPAIRNRIEPIAKYAIDNSYSINLITSGTSKLNIKSNKIDISRNEWLIHDLKLYENNSSKNLDLLKLLTKKRVNSIGIFSNEYEFILNMFKKKYPEIIAAGGKVINSKSEILFIYRNKKWDLPKGKVEKNEKLVYKSFSKIINYKKLKLEKTIKIIQ